MARRWIPRFVVLALAGAGVWWWRQREAGSATPVERGTTPAAAPAAVPATATAPAVAWVAPVDGACPDGYPVKVARSGIIHEPGGRSYDRTVPERCYADAAQAEADGYRRAKA